MAMVFKSERRLEDISTDKNNDLGPGEYYHYSFSKKIKENKKPFLTSCPRSLLDIKDTPGPGAYYQDETHINVLKNVHNEKVSELNDRTNLLAKEKNGLLYQVRFLINSEKKGFNIKSKRFKIINNINNQPGPGQYFKEKKNKRKKKLKNINENFSNKKINIIKKNEFQIIPTIPAKNSIFGFDILDNGTVIKKQNPDMYRTFTGEKGDTVGPGSYEIEKPNNWLKTGTSWSKLRTVRDCNKNNNDFSASTTTTFFSESKKNNSNKFGSKISPRYSKDLEDTNVLELNDVDNININNLKKTNNNIRKKDKKNVFNLLVENCKLNNRKKCKTEKTFENVIKNITPGPGYYITQKDNTSFRVKLIPEYKQFFGSKLSRFSDINNNYINHLGPGEYFKQENKINQKISKTSSLGVVPPFFSKVERFIISEEKKNLPGPGDYTGEITSEKPKKNSSSSLDGNFGSNELRFNDINLKWKQSVPGPGFYGSERDIQYILSQKNKKIKKGTIYNSNKADMERQNNIKINNLIKDEIKKEEIPPLGLYNPDVITSIDYKIKKNAYESRNNNNIAFTTTFNKKKKKKNNIEVNCINSNLGPGYYYHEKRNIDTKLSPVFHLPEFKKNSNPNININVGPGKYNIDSYNEWSKKSFNINYV
jgi:hypothetical protein